MLAAGKKVPPVRTSSFDSNKITPGTEYMMEICDNLRWYIADRISHNPAWQNVTVILSDGSVPGEGEHKIMDYIRRERAQPNYDPNTRCVSAVCFQERHIIHGLDADLIMLGLATHEAYFYILREEVTSSTLQVTRCARCGSDTHLWARGAALTRRAAQCQGKKPQPRGVLTRESKYMRQPLQILQLPVLREYLQGEFGLLQRVVPFPYDFEHVLDDLVLLCFLVGNDFLPRLPCLNIREGALDLLFNLYKSILPAEGGYLTAEGGKIELPRLHRVFEELAKVEGEILRRRRSVFFYRFSPQSRAD